ncbi:MAG: hypothetical protein HDT47_08550 [Ruminococcaceae bacterium]|nr:hypothetical protein [Oscillospiraceae bacterium]
MRTAAAQSADTDVGTHSRRLFARTQTVAAQSVDKDVNARSGGFAYFCVSFNYSL